MSTTDARETAQSLHVPDSSDAPVRAASGAPHLRVVTITTAILTTVTLLYANLVESPWKAMPKDWAIAPVTVGQLVLAAVFVASALMTARVTAVRQDPAQNITAKAGQDPTVTPVSGPRWLTRLGIRSGESRRGRSGVRHSGVAGVDASAPARSIAARVARR